MKKVFKVFAWLLLGSITLALTLFVALKIYFTQERIKAIITSYVSVNFKREVDFKSASLNFRGFSIEELRLSEFSSFKNGQFFSVKELDIHPDLKALLKKQIKVSSIQGSGVQVSIIQIDSTTYNFTDLLQSPGLSASDGTKAQPKGIAFTIAKITLKDSTLSYKSLDGSITANVTNIRIGAGAVSDRGFFPLDADFKMSVKSPYLSGDFPASIKGLIDLAGFDINAGKAKIENAHIEAGNIACDLKGEFTGFLSPHAKITMEVKPFSSSDLREYSTAIPPHIPIPAIEVKSDFDLTTSSVVFKTLSARSGPVEGEFKGNLIWDPAFDCTLNAELLAHTPAIKTDALAEISTMVPKGYYLPRTDISVKALITPKKVTLTEASISGADIAASAAGDIYQSPFAVSAVIRISSANLRGVAGLSPDFKSYNLKGILSGKLNSKFTKSLLMNGSASFKGVGAKFIGNELSELKGGVTVTKKQIKSKGIRAKLNGSDIKLDFSATKYLTHPDATLNLDLAALELTASTVPAKAEVAISTSGKKPIPQAQTKTPPFDLKGKSRIGAISHPQFTSRETLFTYNLKNISTDFSGLSGEASFDIKGGKFDNLCEIAEQYKVAKVALYPMVILSVASKTVKGIKLPDFNTIVFTKLEGDYLFQNGSMELKKSNLEAELADATVLGNINLITQALDLKISVKLKKASGISMSVPLVMKVKGTFDAPSVKVDMKSVMDQPVVKKGIKQLAEEGTKLLDKLFNKKKKK